MSDRRRHVRRAVELTATYKLEGKPAVETQITDMSPGGAYVELPEVLDFGTKMRLTIMLPKTKGITVDAIVRWLKPGGAGVQFGALGASDTYQITEFLATAAVIPSLVPLVPSPE